MKSFLVMLISTCFSNFLIGKTHINYIDTATIRKYDSLIIDYYKKTPFHRKPIVKHVVYYNLQFSINTNNDSVEVKYYKTGIPENSISYLHGIKSGMSMYFYKSSQTKGEYWYENDTLNFGFKEYYNDAFHSIFLMGQYSKGKKNDTFVYYWPVKKGIKPNEQRNQFGKCRIIYKNDMRDGYWIYWTKNGYTVREEWYENGEFIKAYTYNRKGKMDGVLTPAK